jgi:hypothetical protein
LLTTGAFVAAGFLAGAAVLTTLVGFTAAERRPGFAVFVAGLTAFLGAAFAMFWESFI